MADQQPPQQQSQILDYREIGATGLRRFSGFIYEEFLLELTGWKGIAVYKEMSRNDATVGAILFAIDKICRQVQWRTEPASSQPYDIEAADFLATCMNDMSMTWIDTISEILSMLTYGYSVHEIVYKRRNGDAIDPQYKSKYSDGRIGWRKIPIRSQDSVYRWKFDDHGGIQGFWQLAPPHYYNTLIPIEKLLLFRTAIVKNDPEGISILRNAYRAWYMKKNIENIEAIGIERDLAGLPVALVPPEILSSNASATQKQILGSIKEIVSNIRRDEQEGVVFPAAYDANGKLTYELKLLSTGGSRQFDTDKTINRYKTDIAQSVVADFILMGHQNVGSYALSSSKTELFFTAIGAFLDIVADVFNRYAIPRLFDLNDFQMSDYPKIVHGDLEHVDLKELGDFIVKLTQSGMPMFPNPDLEKFLYKAASLPEPPDLEKSQSLQVEPKPRGEKEKIVIPWTPIQTPNGLFSEMDTTPVNGQPAPHLVTITTNVNPQPGELTELLNTSIRQGL